MISEEKQIEALLNTARELAWRMGDFECYCDPGECTDEKPNCLNRQVRKTVRTIESVIDFEVRSITPGRLSNVPEAIFVDQWRKRNKREPWLNHGIRSLEWIAAKEPDRWRYVSQDEADIVTAVIQWLGTNCGSAFLREAERQIEAARDSGSKTWHAIRDNNNGAFPDSEKPLDPIAVEARRIAMIYYHNCETREDEKKGGPDCLTFTQSVEGALRRFLRYQNSVIEGFNGDYFECKCGSEFLQMVTLLDPAHEAIGSYQVACDECGRRGAMAGTPADAITLYDCKVKKGGDEQ